MGRPAKTEEEKAAIAAEKEAEKEAEKAAKLAETEAAKLAATEELATPPPVEEVAPSVKKKQLQKLFADYAAQNPVKAAAKKAEFEAKLAAL